MSRERRRSKRIAFKTNADIISSGKSYAGSVKDVSEQGLGYLLSSIPEVSKDFTPDRTIDLIIKGPAGKKYKLNCEVKWYLRGKGRDKSMTFGMKVNNPPLKYKDLIDSLTHGEDS